MNRSRVVFIAIIAIALCLVALGAIGAAGDWWAARLQHLSALPIETVVVTSTRPEPTLTPFPTDTPPPTLLPLPTVTPGPIRPPEATTLPVPTPLKLEAKVGAFSPIASGNALFFVGEVHNIGDQPLERPEVSVVLYDATGQVLASERGFATQDTVAPGQRVPVRIVFTTPPAQWIKFQVLFQPQAATEPGLHNYADLTTSALKLVRSPASGYLVNGTVKNSGARQARYIQAVVTLYGGSGQVVGVGEDLTDPDHLAPNGSAVFTVTIYSVAAEPISYRVQLVANTP
jgi:Protein of unknown function (DUF3426)